MTAREALAQEWRDRLKDFALSEMTVQEWCDFNNLSTHQYYYWKRRLAAHQKQEQTKPAFLALSIENASPAPTSAGGVTIRIAGAVVEVAPNFNPNILRAVVSALAAKPC